MVIRDGKPVTLLFLYIRYLEKRSTRHYALRWKIPVYKVDKIYNAHRKTVQTREVDAVTRKSQLTTICNLTVTR